MAALFLVRQGKVITPSVSNDILESITRAAVIRLLEEVLEIPVTERDVDGTELYGVGELFLCGTGV